MSPFCILLELRMLEVTVTTGPICCAKLQSNCHHQQTYTQLFTGQMPFLSPNQQCQSTEGNHAPLKRDIAKSETAQVNFHTCKSNKMLAQRSRTSSNGQSVDKRNRSGSCSFTSCLGSPTENVRRP